VVYPLGSASHNRPSPRDMHRTRYQKVSGDNLYLHPSATSSDLILLLTCPSLVVFVPPCSLLALDSSAPPPSRHFALFHLGQMGDAAVGDALVLHHQRKTVLPSTADNPAGFVSDLIPPLISAPQVSPTARLLSADLDPSHSSDVTCKCNGTGGHDIL